MFKIKLIGIALACALLTSALFYYRGVLHGKQRADDAQAHRIIKEVQQNERIEKAVKRMDGTAIDRALLEWVRPDDQASTAP